jgi:hypothetical protein
LLGLSPAIVKIVWAEVIAASNRNAVSKVRFFMGGLISNIINAVY